jgi:hypothetical protein
MKSAKLYPWIFAAFFIFMLGACGGGSGSSSQDVHKSEAYVWADGVLKVTIQSLKKADKRVTMTVLYENLSDKPIRIQYYSGKPYLSDESGNMGAVFEDSANINDGKDLLPGKSIRSKTTAYFARESSAKAFDLHMSSWYPRGKQGHSFDLAINNIKAN